MQTYEQAPENSFASFIPMMGFEEHPLWVLADTMAEGQSETGTLIIRFADTEKVEQYNGRIIIQNDGILFEEQ